LLTDGWDVTVVSPVVPGGSGLSVYGAETFHDEERDVNVLVPPTATVFGIRPINHALTLALAVLYTVILYHRFDETVSLTYNFRPENALPSFVGKHLFGTTYVLQYEDGLFVHQSRLRRVTAKFTKRLCNSSLDGAVCTNTNLADVLETNNTRIFRGFPSIGMPETLPDSVYADSERVIIMFAGHFDSVRGIDLFLDAVPQLEKEDVALWISGTGRDEEKARVRDRIEQINDDRITYFGTLPWEEYRKRVVSADILVNFQSPDMPISAYTFPSKLLDFMSAGAVVVSTDMSDLSAELGEELVIDGATAEDVRLILEETVDSYQNSDLETNSRARDWVETHCTHEYAGEQYGAVIRTELVN
jgi:glycosyltransferase involved in cell wall biosynthesis